MLSDLPTELAEEVLSRVPMKYTRAVGFVCKKWNTLSKNPSVLKTRLGKAAAAREFTVVVVAGLRASLMSVNLHGIDPSINHQGKLVSITNSDRVDIYQVHHCDGLLLCTLLNDDRWVVWNPYLGQTRLFEFEPTPISDDPPLFSIGYEDSKSYRSYKVLRFEQLSKHQLVYQLHYINSKDITVPITIPKDWGLMAFALGASVKGNTYWYAQAQEKVEDYYPVFLICFDFTRETFGPRLCLPFQSYLGDTVTLSSVRDEQLAVLFQNHETCEIEIWITTKIEPNVASWGKVFLEVGMSRVPFLCEAGSFFVDEEKKVAVVFNHTKTATRMHYLHKVAFVIGQDGYFKKVVFGEVFNMNSYITGPIISSYVPSLAEIIPPARGVKRKRTKLFTAKPPLEIPPPPVPRRR